MQLQYFNYPILRTFIYIPSPLLSDHPCAHIRPLLNSSQHLCNSSHQTLRQASLRCALPSHPPLIHVLFTDLAFAALLFVRTSIRCYYCFGANPHQKQRSPSVPPALPLCDLCSPATLCLLLSPPCHSRHLLIRLPIKLV